MMSCMTMKFPEGRFCQPDAACHGRLSEYAAVRTIKMRSVTASWVRLSSLTLDCAMVQWV